MFYVLFYVLSLSLYVLSLSLYVLSLSLYVLLSHTQGGVLSPPTLNSTWYTLSAQLQPLMTQTNGRLVDDTQFKAFLQRRTMVLCQQMEKYGLCPFF
jgi:hypothetical protein